MVWLRLLGFCQRDGKDAILVLGLHVGGLHGQGQRDTPVEAAEKPLAPERIAFLDLALLLALAGDGQCVFMEGNLNVLLFHARKFALHEHVVLILENVQGRTPHAQQPVFPVAEPRLGYIKKPVHLVPKGREPDKGTPRR